MGFGMELLVNFSNLLLLECFEYFFKDYELCESLILNLVQVIACLIFQSNLSDLPELPLSVESEDQVDLFTPNFEGK